MPGSKLHVELTASWGYSPPIHDHRCSEVILALCRGMTTGLHPY